MVTFIPLCASVCTCMCSYICVYACVCLCVCACMCVYVCVVYVHTVCVQLYVHMWRSKVDFKYLPFCRLAFESRSPELDLSARLAGQQATKSPHVCASIHSAGITSTYHCAWLLCGYSESEIRILPLCSRHFAY